MPVISPSVEPVSFDVEAGYLGAFLGTSTLFFFGWTVIQGRNVGPPGDRRGSAFALRRIFRLS